MPANPGPRSRWSLLEGASFDPLMGYEWLVVARWVFVGFIAGCAILADFFQIVPSGLPLLVCCGCMAGYNAFLAWSALPRKDPARTIRWTLLLDIVLFTSILHYSGDIENPFRFLYTLPVVAGAVILSRRAGYLLTLASIGAFCLLLALTLIDKMPVSLPHHHLDLMKSLQIHKIIDPDVNFEGWNYVAIHVFALSVLLLACAYGFGTLAARIRESERQVEEQNERMRSLLTILPEGVVLMELDGGILWANPAAAGLAPGLAAASCIQDLPDGLGVPERLKEGRTRTTEFESVRPDRILRHALLGTGTGGRIVWVFQDVTELRRLMAVALHQSKMVDLGYLAAGIAHEIGNPLSSISAILQVMQAKHPGPGIGERLTVLISHVDRIDRIVRDVTSFARPSAGMRPSVPLERVVDTSLQIFRMHDRARDITVRFDRPGLSRMACLAEDQFVQVLLNLLLNAADASKRPAEVQVSLSGGEDEVRIEVADRGAGMEEETQRRLFTPFFTTKEPGRGVGLGLFLSDWIVRSHGGRIEVTSAPGVGTTVRVCLPVKGVPMTIPAGNSSGGENGESLAG